MSECSTIPFLQEFSGCLVENPSCGFATRCGFSYHCEHPNHREFQTSGGMLLDVNEKRNRYHDLKEARRLKHQQEARKSS